MQVVPQPIIRCDWVGDNPLYLNYHDCEWGKINHNNQSLFEFICLEGQQAGLSWITILKKRMAYRTLFHEFDALKIVQMNEQDVSRLMQENGIIKNKLKIESIIQNARAFLEIQETQSFDEFIWQLTDYQPIINYWDDSLKIPAKTNLSEQLSKLLKSNGFNFVGPTICYAFMQACGMVNDHLVSCFCHPSQQPKASFSKNSIPL